MNNKNNQITIGDMYGYWQVIDSDPHKPKTYFKCLCTGCGKTLKTLRKWTLLRGESKSCGCKLKEAMKETNQIRYNTDWSQQNETIREKSKQTCLKNHGVDNYCRSEERKEKTKQTNLEKYGTEHHLQNEQIIEKRRQNNLEKYGVDSPSKLTRVKGKIRSKMTKKPVFGVDPYGKDKNYGKDKEEKDS